MRFMLDIGTVQKVGIVDLSPTGSAHFETVLGARYKTNMYNHHQFRKFTPFHIGDGMIHQTYQKKEL